MWEGGGLPAVLHFITHYGTAVHKDTLHSAMAVVSRYDANHKCSTYDRYSTLGVNTVLVCNLLKSLPSIYMMDKNYLVYNVCRMKWNVFKSILNKSQFVRLYVNLIAIQHHLQNKAVF